VTIWGALVRGVIAKMQKKEGTTTGAWEFPFVKISPDLKLLRVSASAYCCKCENSHNWAIRFAIAAMNKTRSSTDNPLGNPYNVSPNSTAPQSENSENFPRKGPPVLVKVSLWSTLSCCNRGQQRA